jgi:hypothetical protein
MSRCDSNCVRAGWRRPSGIQLPAAVKQCGVRGARRGYLLRGRDILVTLKQAGRLLPNQDWVAWFDEQLAAL